MARLLVLAGLTGWSCAPAGQPAQPGEPELWSVPSRTPDPLSVYRELGFIAGSDRFPAVGRFVFLPGPGDSSFAVLALSMPNSALRFRRESTGFVARYRVESIVGDSAAPAARLDETAEVRVASFRETSRPDESVIFQGLLKLLPGTYRLRLAVRDLTASAGFSVDGELRVPRFADRWITQPLVVHQARLRSDRAAPPTLIISPRATVQFGGDSVRIYLESSHMRDGAVVLQARDHGDVIQTDTLTIRPMGPLMHSATVKLDGRNLPPGALSLTLAPTLGAAVDSATLLVALRRDWLAPAYEDVVGYLRYAAAPTAIDSLLQARPAERARLLHAFLYRRDPAPETPENEFLEAYFRRIADANDRFGVADAAGWLTDRGAVYVTLGPPDEVRRHLDAWQGGGASQVWLYRKSFAAGLRLVFIDRSGAGSFQLTDESRRAFQAAVRDLHR